MKRTMSKTVAIYIGSILFLGVFSCSSGMKVKNEFSESNNKSQPIVIAQKDTVAQEDMATRKDAVVPEDDMAEDSLDDFDFLEDEEEKETIQVADPLKGFNKAMYVFNDKAYFWVLKPVARGYKAVTPEIARKGVKNFFYNLGMPLRFVSCVLQGKVKAAGGELGRFTLNSTVGVLGFGNPAAKFPSLNPDAEDLGQTMGRYGIGNGFYLVLPLMGPTTLRDSVGDLGNWFLDPVSYVTPSLAEYSIKAGEKINDTSLRIGEYESLKDATLDPYTAIRNVYIQHRQEQVER